MTQAWLSALMGGSLSAPPSSLEPQLSLPLSLQFLSSLTQPGSPNFPAVDKALVSGVRAGAVREYYEL